MQMLSQASAKRYRDGIDDDVRDEDSDGGDSVFGSLGPKKAATAAAEAATTTAGNKRRKQIG